MNFHILVDVVDIGLVAVMIYWILRLVRGTRAAYMLLGLTVAVAVYWASSQGELYTMNWILSNFFGSLLLIVVVVFQNDIRRALTQVGQTPFFAPLSGPQDFKVMEDLVRTCVSLANKKIGALIVLERDANVMDYVEVGVRLDAALSKELLTSIFLPVSPLHDGAVVVQKAKVVAAGCFLPLTMNPRFGVEYGTRHRAAIGLTEETDSVVIIVSEEHGWISVAIEGRVTTGVDGAGLRKLLLEYFKPHVSPLRKIWRQWHRPRPELP